MSNKTDFHSVTDCQSAVLCDMHRLSTRCAQFFVLPFLQWRSVIVFVGRTLFDTNANIQNACMYNSV